MTNETLAMGNNEVMSRGVFRQSDGTFLAMTFTRSKSFKTRLGAERWFTRQTGEPSARDLAKAALVEWYENTAGGCVLRAFADGNFTTIHAK